MKLDTNGSRPSVVKNLAAADLINKVAMDIKACPSNYHVLTGVHADLDGIRKLPDGCWTDTLIMNFVQQL